jgi:cell division protein FtsI (penicillin-binding protein 3)
LKAHKPSTSERVNRRRPDPQQEVRAVRRRIRFIAGCFIVLCAVLALRAFYLQVLSAPQWQERARNQHRKIIPLTPQRGALFDAQGEALAVSLEADSAYVNPEFLHRILAQQADGAGRLSQMAAAIAPLIGEKPQWVLERMQRDKKFVWLKRRMAPDRAAALRALELPGVFFTREHKRWYPNGRVGSQVIGFSGIDNRGLEGLERRYDPLIAGDGGYLVTRKDASGRSLGSGERVEAGRRGRDLYLTIDKQIQYIAEHELAEAVTSSKARGGVAVVMEPATGRVLAMASQPDYDPNQFGRFPAATRRNRVVCDSYEPGSTFKLFLLAAALNEELFKPQQQIDCTKSGHYAIGGKVIHDHRALGVLTVADVLKFSSNIGCAKIAQQLGRETFYRYLREFGFGQLTQIDFDGEVGGLLRAPQDWFEIDLAAISFGQGVTVTPLQLATATCAVVNGGRLMQPYLVERIVDPRTGAEQLHSPREVRQVLRPAVAQQLRDMMVRVADVDGTGSRARVPGFLVGGKTGTAQKVDPVTGTYSVDKRVSSFVGFAPAEAPRLVVLVALDEPRGEVYGGILAAPVFSRIVEQTLRYLRVAPTQPLEDASRTARPSSPPPREVAPALLSEMPPVPTQNGAPQSRMPDFKGLTARDVLALMARSGLNLRIEGYGRVVRQQPAAGQALDATTPLTLYLQPPQEAIYATD